METKKSTSFYSTSVDKRNKLVEISADTLLYPPKRRRNRLSVSCLNCKKRKVKCDRGRPVCGTCAKNNLPIGSCLYSTYLSIDSIEKTNKLKEIYPNTEYFPVNEQNALNPTIQPIPAGNIATPSNGFKNDNRALPFPPPQPMHQMYRSPYSQSDGMMNNFPPRFPPFNAPFPVEASSNGNGNNIGNLDSKSQTENENNHTNFNSNNNNIIINNNNDNSTNDHINNNNIADNSATHNPNANIEQNGKMVPSQTTPNDPLTDSSMFSNSGKMYMKTYQTLVVEKQEMEERYLREIEDLKSRLKREIASKAFPSLTNTENIENSPIFKDLSLIQNLDFDPARRAYRVEKTSALTFYGPSCWRLNVVTDKIFGPTLMSFTDLFKAERRLWKLKFQSETDHLYAEYEVKVLQGVTGDNYKYKYHQNILSFLGEILPSHEEIEQCIDTFFKELKEHISFVPEGVIRYFFKLHFIKSENGRIKFRLYEEKQDFARISSVLMVLKVTLLFYPTSWDDRDLIFWFAGKLSDSAGAKWKASIPAFITESLSYFVKLRNLKLYECGDLKDTSLYATRSIQMAINMGFHKEKNDVMVTFKTTDRNVIDLITEEEWNNIWIFVQFTDAQVAFISGVPPLLSDFNTSFKAPSSFTSHRMKVIGFYKHVNNLLSYQFKSPNLKLNLKDIEDVILSLEMYHSYELNNITKESLGLPDCTISSTFISYSFKLKICDMLLSLYLLTHRIVKDEIEKDTFKDRDEQLKQEFLELEQRYARRSVNFSVIVLASINYLITRNLGGSEGKKEISAVSVELRSLFLKILTCLSCYMIEMIVLESKTKRLSGEMENGNNGTNNTNNSETSHSSASSPSNSNKKSKTQNLLIDDLDIHSAEALMFPHLSCEKKTLNFPDLVITQEKLNLPFQDAKCLLTFLSGFFYNTQKSAIAPVYTFYAVYKYCFLFCVHLKEKVIDEGVDGEWFLKNLNEKEFCERYEAVDACWFSGAR